MKIAVVGLWHLGCVTAACLAEAGYDVIAFDPMPENIQRLQTGRAPLFEPGLEELIQKNMDTGKLTFTANPEEIHAAEIVWVNYDTPVDHLDVANVGAVMRDTAELFPHLQKNALVIISSQLPAGSTTQLQVQCDNFWAQKNITFAYIPENLRLGKAIEVFSHPDRFVIGLDNLAYKEKLQTLLQPFTNNLIWMSVASAEMTKHAINAFLAVSVTFINELATLCETVGADAREVEAGLKSEERIGPKAYLRPGSAIAGGTLLRDINYLKKLGNENARQTFLINAIADSNKYHTQWARRKLTDLLLNLHGKKIAMLGLTYKAGTDTLRRSTAIETCEWLHSQGTVVTAFDPTITQLPADLANFISIKNNIAEALAEADAVVISTEWPQFRDVSAEEFLQHLKQPYVLDPGGFVAKTIAADKRLNYFSVGVPA